MLVPEIAARIASEGLVTAGFTVFTGFLPETPDKAIVVYETGGLPPEIFFDGATVDRPGIQLVTRGPARDYATPRAQIERLYQAMVGWGAFTVGTVRYLGLSAQQAPFAFDRDGNERVKFAVNLLVEKELS